VSKSRQHRTSGEAVQTVRSERAREGGVGNAARQERMAGAKGRKPPGTFQVLGQTFGSLQSLHDWLVDQAATPGSSVPHEPVLRITLTPGSVISQHEQTTWHYYRPGQKVVLEGHGATVSGLRSKGRPSPGFFLAYRPIVGPDTSESSPAAANFEMRGVTVRGFESGGLQLSPQTGGGVGHEWDGGNTAFMAGAVIAGNRFEDLGSKKTPYRQTSWSGQRYGVGGVLMHGVQQSLIADNDFEDLENGKVRGTNTGQRLIHAVYARDRSSDNDIVGNRFKDVSGDAVRVSNASNDNEIVGNRSRNAGVGALVSEFYNPTAGEQDSTGNQLRGNTVGRLYGRRRRAKAFRETISRAPRPDLD